MDISKEFDRVHHGGLYFKLKQLGIVDDCLKLFANYLGNRRQHVSLCGVTSGVRYINCGVLQGSILGPLLFLINVNDIYNYINSDIKLFADDTTLLYSNPNPSMSHHILSENLNQIDLLAKKWFVKFNCNKSNVLTIYGLSSTINLLSLNNGTLEEVDSYRYLEITFKKTLSWQKHILNICTKANKLIINLLKLTKTISKIVLLRLYSTCIHSTLEYGSAVYDNCSIHDKNLLEKTQMRAAKVILDCMRTTPYAKIR